MPRKKPEAFDCKTKPDPLLNPLQKQILCQKVVEQLIEGVPRRDILKVIEKEMPVKLSKTGMQNIYQLGQTWLELNVELEAEKIIDNHVQIYEKIYNYFQKIGYNKGVLKALFGKERMLGLYKEVKVDVNKKTTVEFTQDVNYDTSKLSAEENTEFQLLLKKATT